MTVLYVNGVIILGFLFLLYTGYKKGFLFKVISLLSFFFMGMLSWWLSSFLQDGFDLYPKSYTLFAGTFLEDLVYASLNRFVWFICLFVISEIGVFIVRRFLKIIDNLPVISSFNRYAGMVLGALQGLCICLIAYLICQLPFWKGASEIADQSLLRFSEPIAEQLLSYIELPMKELQTMFTASGDELSSVDLQTLQEWLQSQNIDDDQIQVVIEALQEEINE